MEKRIRILTIDWDYFFDITSSERVALFPDGGTEDLPEAIQLLIWALHYASHQELFDVGYKSDEFLQVSEFLKSSQFKYKSAGISHKGVYSLVNNVRFIECVDLFDIVNIDFHHDYYNCNTNKEVNCGNWVNALFDSTSPHNHLKKGSSYRWVSREDSDRCSELEKQEWFSYITLEEALKEEYDGIYICRSDVWSPPHLDETFRELVGCVIPVNKKWMKDRIDKDFESLIEQYQSAVNKLKESQG